MNSFHPWRNSMYFALMIWIVALSYAYFFRNTMNLATISEALALTGGILFGCSFILSVMSYYFDFLDKKLKYRREIGLLGYYFALGHAVSLIYRFPAKYVDSFPGWITDTDAILGLIAMGIFTMMALISTRTGMHWSGRHFRPLLRLGYVAYAMLIVRAWLIQSDSWMAWFEAMDTLMPPRLFLSIFALAVIAARIVMEISIRTSKKPSAAR